MHSNWGNLLRCLFENVFYFRDISTCALNVCDLVTFCSYVKRIKILFIFSGAGRSCCSDSCLDYCNVLYMRLPLKLQLAQNANFCWLRFAGRSMLCHCYRSWTSCQQASWWSVKCWNQPPKCYMAWHLVMYGMSSSHWNWPGQFGRNYQQCQTSWRWGGLRLNNAAFKSLCLLFGMTVIQK